MKTTLTIEESACLIELGVDPKLASKWEIVDTTDENDPNSFLDYEEYPIFGLEDILSILPKEIEFDGLTYWLNIWVDSAIWYVEYCAEEGGYNYVIDSNIDASELIDALNSLLIWCLTEKKINLNTEKK